MADTSLPKPTPPQVGTQPSGTPPMDVPLVPPAAAPAPSPIPVMPPATLSPMPAPAMPSAGTPGSVPMPQTPSTPRPSGSGNAAGDLPPIPPLPSSPSNPVKPAPVMAGPSVPPPPAPPMPVAPMVGAPKPGAGGPPQPPKPPVAPAGQAVQPAEKQPVSAKAGKNPLLKFLPFIVGGLVVLALIIFGITRFFGGSSSSTTTDTTAQKAPTKQVAITYWGLWEPTQVMTEVLKEFEKQNPGVLVKYEQQSSKDYRERLQTAIAGGTGPDVFRFHASWVPMLKADLSPLPSSIMSLQQYQTASYPIATKQLQSNGQVVGVPIMYDGLALYYNKQYLTSAGALPPKTWGELSELARKLTVKSSNGIERAGAAIGTANNVDHFSEIIGLLTLQNGGDLAQPTSQASLDAMTFYTNFAKTDPVWSEQMPSSTVAFARGEVAMMFAPSWRYHEIKALNPQLDFGISTVPKLTANEVTWGTYWAEGVSAQSKNKDQAWALIKYLSSADVMKKLYAEQSKVRTFGEIYSRTDLASELVADPVTSPFLAEAKNAQSWYLNRWTFDNGINDQIIKYYQDAVNAMLAGKSAQEVMVTVNQGTSQVLRQYGVSASGTPTSQSSTTAR